MTIRAKFTVFTLSIIVSVIALGIAGIWALNEVAALQKTSNRGTSSISELRRMDLLYKELMTTHTLDATFADWVRAFSVYEATNKEFIEGRHTKSFLNDKDFRDTYNTAMQIMNVNLQRADELKAKFIQKKDRGELGSQGLMYQAFLERREGAFMFQLEVSEASAHFGRMTGEVMQQLVEAIEKRTGEMQANIITVFAAFLLVMTIVISVVSYLFATRISAHIKMVEQAVRLLSTGDVTHSLRIKSNDEFGVLSKNYNEFVGDFKNRLAAGLDFIRDMREAVTTDLDLRNAYRVITRSSVKDTYADAGALLVVDKSSGALRVECVHGFFPVLGRVEVRNKNDREALSLIFKSTTYSPGENIPGQVLENGNPYFIHDNYAELGLPLNAEEGSHSVSSLIAVPFHVGGKVFAVLLVTKSKKGNLFTDMDFIHTQTFADYAALMLDNMIQYIEILEKRETDRDISIASDIQQRLVPKSYPAFESAALGAFSDGARGVSGDYYDYVKLDENRMACVICDVSGKGVAAAFIMVMIRTILRIIIGKVKGTAAILKWINSGLMDKTGMDRFATMAVFLFDAKTKTVTYSNAAHHPLLRYRAKDGTFEELDTNGLPLGVERKAEYEEIEFKVEAGDLLIMYSDGVTELKNESGSMFGSDAMKKSIRNNASQDAKKIADLVQEDLARFMGQARRFDDTSFIVMKIGERSVAASQRAGVEAEAVSIV